MMIYQYDKTQSQEKKRVGEVNGNWKKRNMNMKLQY